MPDNLSEYLDGIDEYYKAVPAESVKSLSRAVTTLAYNARIDLPKVCKMLRHVVDALEVVADHTSLDQVALLNELNRMAKEASE